jgi:hypothetical protein
MLTYVARYFETLVSQIPLFWRLGNLAGHTASDADVSVSLSAAEKTLELAHVLLVEGFVKEFERRHDAHSDVEALETEFFEAFDELFALPLFVRFMVRNKHLERLIERLMHSKSAMDVSRLDYILLHLRREMSDEQAEQDAAARDRVSGAAVAASSAATRPGRRDDARRNSDRAQGSRSESASASASASTGAAASSSEMDGKIATIREMMPELGAGFVEACLRACGVRWSVFLLLLHTLSPYQSSA